MSNIVERFLRYVKIDTMSDEFSSNIPSTAKQFDLANLLVAELKEVGLFDAHVDENCIVYAHLPANVQGDYDKIGFLAHMDTSPAMSGANVQPRIIKNYQGEVIVLNEDKKIYLDPKQFPILKRDIGDDLIVTNGETLLGGDDKAGIAIIMTLLEYLQKHPEVPHGPISIAFTPDEEIGTGVLHMDLKKFDADYAYTIDGFDCNDLSFECFNAASAEVKIQGLSVHPGSAKGKMINSLLVAMEFQNLLPVFSNPMYTQGREGFHHLCDMAGDCENSVMHYILRNHRLDLLEKQKQQMLDAQNFLNKKYGTGTCEVVITDSYRNMREKIEEHPIILERARKAMKKLGLTPYSEPVRGGTDGSSLTMMGMPTPNLGTGDRNCHGKFEYVAIGHMKKVSELLIEMVKVEN